MRKELSRCSWSTSDPLYIDYHDREWGVPIHDDRLLFEMLNLEGAQAGLSWLTILRKRKNYQKAFDHFDVKKIARYDSKKVERLLKDEGIVRHRLKIESVISNARAFLEVQKEFSTFDQYIWSFAPADPNRAPKRIPTTSPESDRMSKDLKKRGFRFVGSTICYAYMQAIGMVNDHTESCFRRKELTRKKKAK